VRLTLLLCATISILAVAGLASSCHPEKVNIVCVDTSRIAIVLEVRDSVSGAGAAVGTSLVVRDGVFVDSTVTAAYSATHMAWLPQRPGIYTVTLRHTGYREWIKPGVALLSERCGVQQVQLFARLQPL
jgi:hypothetical protein